MEQTQIMYTYARKAAKKALDSGRESEVGRIYDFMMCNVFAAFCFEGYLNHLGAVVEAWCDEQGQRLSWKEKARVLFPEVDENLSLGKEPFQTVAKAFRFRDTMAHPRTQVITEEKAVSVETVCDAPIPVAQWEAECSLEFAEKSLAAVEDGVRQLNAAARDKGARLFLDPFAVMAHGSGRACR